MRKSISHLLTRDEFRNSVFARDGFACVQCGRDDVPLDAHHILERRLFGDGGFYLDNGATLCDQGREGCHMKAEQSLISVEDLREKCGIQRKVIPEQLYEDHIYDKWGNSILQDGRRLPGPLFFDDSVQMVLAPVLDLFIMRFKQPRTMHLPWSRGAQSDDKFIETLAGFEGEDVVVTEKMDGENTSCYPDSYVHARSVDGRNHPSRDWVKSFWAIRAHDLPAGWRLVGENLFAKHAIGYDGLPGYLMGISVWNEKNECLSWDETQEWFELLEVPSVPVLYRGPFCAKTIQGLYDEDQDWSRSEGLVVRVARSFPAHEWPRVVGKQVRSGHVQTTKHWMRKEITQNGLIPGKIF